MQRNPMYIAPVICLNSGGSDEMTQIEPEVILDTQASFVIETGSGSGRYNDNVWIFAPWKVVILGFRFR